MLFSPANSQNAMHIPDGFLSIIVSGIFWIISIVVIGIALKKINEQKNEKDIPLMGILAAAIFAGQMLNFSVSGGTSGHLLGAAIASILLGPWQAVLVMTTVVSVQALVFQDGGLIVLGANLFNMAIVGVFVANTVFSFLKNIFAKKTWGILAAGFFAAWTSIFIASLSCAIQLALSGTSPANIAIPAMAIIHAIIGIGEGLITLGALGFILASRRDLIIQQDVNKQGGKGILVAGGIISIVLVVLSPLASSHPDGLEWVAEQHGFLDFARESFYYIIPDYSMPGINNPALATIIAGIIGAAIVFVVAFSVARAKKM